jgi:hypothetical protein
MSASQGPHAVVECARVATALAAFYEARGLIALATHWRAQASLVGVES